MGSGRHSTGDGRLHGDFKTVRVVSSWVNFWRANSRVCSSYALAVKKHLEKEEGSGNKS